MATMSRSCIIIACAATAFIAVAAWLYFSYDPASVGIFPKCMFLQLTGYKCPGCGSQRAIHALLNGDLAVAWRMNALLVSALPLIAVLLAAEFMRTRNNAFYARVNSRFVVWTLAILIVGWWILRNIFGC